VEEAPGSDGYVIYAFL